jgi:anaerobic selenocysteine-containing dehydrogenase
MSGAVSLADGVVSNPAGRRVFGDDRETVGYTFCDGCNQMPFCGIKFYRKGNIITRLESWPGFPASPLCSKGYATLQRLYNPNRLQYPMKRTNPKGSSDPGFARISWDEAYDAIVGHLNRIKEQYSPHQVFFYGGDPKELRAPLQRMLVSYGSVQWGSESSTGCRRAAQLAELLTYGFSTLGNLPTEETQTMLIWGTNPAYSGQPYMCHGHLIDARDRGVKFIVVDPRRTPTASLADIHLQLRPASTAALAAGLMHVIFKEGLENREFCENWIHGLDELKEYVKGFDPDRVEKLTWVPAGKIIEAARLYATNGPSGFLTSGQSTTHTQNAVNDHRSLLLLPAVCGYIDIPGGLAQPTNPLMSPWADGQAEFCLREKLLSMREHRLDIADFPAWAEKHFEVQTNYLPEYIRAGRVKALIGFGFNMMIWPQTHVYQKAIESLEFSAAVDNFYRPQTHPFMDIILPASMNFERLAPFAFIGRTIYGRSNLVDPPGECREDWQIALEIGARLGHGDLCFNGDVEAACNEILKTWGITYDDLRKNQESGVTIPTKRPEMYEKYRTGNLRRDKKPGFNTPSGKIEAISLALKKHGYPALPEYREPVAQSEDYPLLMLSGSRVPFITHSKWRDDSPWLLELQPGPLLTINPEDAASRGLEEGGDAIVRSRYGAIRVKVALSVIVPPGVISMMHGWDRANVNELVPRNFDPISGFPPYKDVACEVAEADT